jgi:acyl transferase domain-containing protein
VCLDQRRVPINHQNVVETPLTRNRLGGETGASFGVRDDKTEDIRVSSGSVETTTTYTLDPAFFGISPREAERIDPQQRLLLETTWEAFEYAGIRPDTLRGSAAGVFVGIMWNDYFRMQLADVEAIDPYTGSGGQFAFAANRISYFFNLTGPSIASPT